MTRTRGAQFALLAVLAVLLGAAGAAPARAEDTGYRYWSLWELTEGEGWTYATEGPGTLRPGDGDVLGFRFAVSVEASDVHQPRGEADFGAVCGATEVAAGGKRVALVIDFGTPDHAPDGERPPRPFSRCVELGGDGTASEALSEAAGPLRYSSDGLLCAIGGYPARGCGEQVSGEGDGEAAASDEAPDDGSGGDGGPVAVAAGVAVVAVLATAAFLRSRRGRA